jgi:hypothetical protein
VAAFVAPKLLAGYLALNHSNDAAFDLGRLTLCIGTDGEHIIAATSSMQIQRLGRRSMVANSGSTNRDVEHGHGGLIDNEILRNCGESLGKIGRDDRIRTCYPHTPSVRLVYIWRYLQITIDLNMYEKMLVFNRNGILTCLDIPQM